MGTRMAKVECWLSDANTYCKDCKWTPYTRDPVARKYQDISVFPNLPGTR